MTQITVRQANPDDFRAIEVVHLSAFEGDEELRLVDTLRNSSGYIPSLSMVAEFNNRIVGHILLSKVTMIRNRDQLEVLALAPMAVVPSQSHRGIGSELVQQAVSRAKSLGYKAIVVAGYPDFYQRFGFQPASRWDLTTNLGISGELVTAMELEPGFLEGGGNVIYPSLFEHVY